MPPRFVGELRMSSSPAFAVLRADGDLAFVEFRPFAPLLMRTRIYSLASGRRNLYAAP
jgi:hypothetical protein